MLRSGLKLLIVLVIGLVAYNYFYGTPQERRQSRELVGKARDLGQDAWDLLQGEREKMRAGKYDDALDKLERLYTDLSQVARDGNDSRLLDRLSELTERRESLESLVDRKEELSAADRRKLDELTADTEVLMNEMEAKSGSRAPY
ncbi:hypothetical protein [Neolewinella litorea]|uniref:Uncharacterized protein n=1 Tax=Neolewinella litorea TaxID=2562452 RepID=A0A4S4NPF4_9BACT|nr:hypothetical protein [Neolewinella litorea]THH41916.1 hypothetical protein E4021_04820 [Neolewinella litorea]